MRKAGGGDLWSEAEPSGTGRASWRLKAVPMGVATARFLAAPPLSPPTGLSRTKCCVHCSLCGHAAGDAKGENNFSEVRHLLAPCLSP
jgi:hypothetical protein